MQLSALYALTQPLILASECVSQLKGKRDDDKKQKALPTDAGGAFFWVNQFCSEISSGQRQLLAA